MAPTPFRISRSTLIDAPAERIHDLITDFHAWTAWSPWEDVDPNLQRSYSGAERGVGAAYAWTGNSKAGAGDMTITADEPRHITIALNFLKPFPARNTIDFTIEDAADGRSRVEWAMSGETKGFAKVMGLFFNMDKMVGPDFERGLRQLKAAAEAAPAA